MFQTEIQPLTFLKVGNLLIKNYKLTSSFLVWKLKINVPNVFPEFTFALIGLECYFSHDDPGNVQGKASL